MIKDHKNHPDVCGKETDSKKPAIDDEAWFDIAKNDNILRDQIYSRMPVHLPSRFYGRSILTPSLQRFDTGAERNKDIEQVALRTNPVERGKIRPNVRDVEPYGGRREVQPRTSSFQSRSNPIGFISDPSANLGSGSEYDFKERVTRTWHRQKNASLMNNEPFKVDPPVAQTDKDVQLPCEFCENLFPEEDLILHQSGCNSLASVSCSDPKHTPTAFLKDEKKQVHDWTYQPSEHIRSESPTEFIQKSSSIFIPCEFCGEQMEEDVLLSHQFRCNPHAYASFCDRTTSSSVLEYEKTSVCDWTKEPSDQTIHPNSPPTTLCRSDNILIPCEFCGVQMEENVLFHHQDQCDFCPDPIHPSSDDPFYQGIYNILHPQGMGTQGTTVPRRRS
ncbi:hypothetical protein GDO86_002080 [Hymenochirus boettgeri]|uniref:Uncharacterized protein n=1 Tax=Hymenochirus boettgeri TaxID=247094 RepID=A0A8T2KFE9_9PIPI|nr:hypothetical protein GDO86_002080 [Hymenochirus boettgeri]